MTHSGRLPPSIGVLRNVHSITSLALQSSGCGTLRPPFSLQSRLAGEQNRVHLYAYLVAIWGILIECAAWNCTTVAINLVLDHRGGEGFPTLAKSFYSG